MKKGLVPALRFPEFRDAGEWEQLPIGDKVDLLSGYPFKSEEISEDASGIPLMRGVNITEGYIRHGRDIDRFFLGDVKKLEKYFIQINDLVIGMDGSKVGKNSALITDKDFGALLIQRVARLRTECKATISFIFQHINSIKFHSYVDRINTSSGIPHISAKQINEFEICFPPVEKEQQKIADCLSSIDELVTAQTQKVEVLKAHKKGLMQQLFPAEGETIPKLRFLEFSGEWKLKKIGDFIESYKGGAALTPSDFSSFSDCQVIPKKAITEGGWLKIDNEKPTYCNEEFYKNNLQSVVDSSYLITTLRDLVPSGPSIGYIVKYVGNINYILAQGVYGLKPKKTFISDFLIHFSNSDIYRKMMQSVMVGSTQVHIRNSTYLGLPICVPSLEEQQKIADCLSSIDDLITAQTQKLATLKAHKKGLMQQLFPSVDLVTE